MGSLIAALASYLDIKQKGGAWYVRIDDLDPPRQDSEASAQILQSLHAHGLHGDQAVDYQSTHTDRYRHALSEISGNVFYCGCSRKSVAAHKVYPGTCRTQTSALPDTAMRLMVGSAQITFDDAKQGPQRCDLASERGDFIVKRRDGLWAYNFATAVDDGLDVSHVLRGQDLFHVTPQQIVVMQMLGLQPPHYTHIPVLTFVDGAKLSKQAHAPALNDIDAPANLQKALFYLGFEPPRENQWSVAQWLCWGLEQWQLERVPAQLPFYLSDSF
jgi:glutamyl-Q tRNA(Asp) synthetase